MKKSVIVIVLLTSMMYSCVVSEKVMPPYTNVQKILNVKKGMTLKQTNSTLGIEPYDIYNIQEDGGSILVYHYRTKQRKMTLPEDFKKREKILRGEERSQTEGVSWYDTDHKLVYVLFQDEKVKSLITDQGRADGEFILFSNNNIRKITKDNLTTFRTVLDSSQTAKSLIIPISDFYKKSKKAEKEISLSKNKSKVGTKIAAATGGILGLTTLIILLALL